MVYSRKENIIGFLRFFIHTLPKSLIIYVLIMILAIPTENPFRFNKLNMIVGILIIIIVFFDKLRELKEDIRSEEENEKIDELNDYLRIITLFGESAIEKKKSKGKKKASPKK